MTIAGKEEKVLEIKRKIAEEWQITDQGDTTYVLGLDVEREPRAVLLSQKSYIKQVAADYSEVVKKFDGVQNISAAANRMLAAQRAIAKGESPSDDDGCEWKDLFETDIRCVIGKLQNLAGMTRPDIAYYTGLLARHTHRVTKEVWELAAMLVAYVAKTPELKMRFGGQELYDQLKRNKVQVKVHTDADWCKEYHGHSIAGRVIKVGSGIVSWGSKKLNNASTSTCDAEYAALLMARQYGVQQVELLRELGYEVDKIHFCTDNQGAETAVVAETITPLMKSRWTKELVMRKEYEDGLLDVVKIPAEQNMADCMTKPLAKNKMHDLRQMWLGRGWLEFRAADSCLKPDS